MRSPRHFPPVYELANRLLSLFGYTEEDVRNGGIGMLRSKVMLHGVDKVCAKLACVPA